MKKKIIIVLIVILLLVSLAAAWFFWFDQGKQMQETTEAPPAAPFVTVETAPIVINLIQKNSVTRRVSVIVRMEVAEGDDHKTLKKQKKRLRDRFMVELHALYSYRIFTLEGYGSELIRKRLKKVADEAVGPDLLRGLSIEVENVFKPRRI